MLCFRNIFRKILKIIHVLQLDLLPPLSWFTLYVSRMTSRPESTPRRPTGRTSSQTVAPSRKSILSSVLLLLINLDSITCLTRINIGLLLHDQSLWNVANDSFSDKDSPDLEYKTLYKPVMSNPINAALDLCEQLVTKQASF